MFEEFDLENIKLPDDEDFSYIFARIEKLSEKWQDYVEFGWYGFDLPIIPEIWIDCIDSLLKYCQSKCPNFRILQIKLKFGGIRMYLSGLDAETENLVEDICRKMYNDRMVY